MVLQKLREQLKGLEEELHKVPVTLEELKQVLNVINTIRSTSMNMELRYVDLEERFRSAGLSHLRVAHASHSQRDACATAACPSCMLAQSFMLCHHMLP